MEQELHVFTSKDKLAFYRAVEEPKRALEKAEHLPAKDRAPMYRRICMTHILTELSKSYFFFLVLGVSVDWILRFIHAVWSAKAENCTVWELGCCGDELANHPALVAR